MSLGKRYGNLQICWGGERKNHTRVCICTKQPRESFRVAASSSAAEIRAVGRYLQGMGKEGHTNSWSTWPACSGLGLEHPPLTKDTARKCSPGTDHLSKSLGSCSLAPGCGFNLHPWMWVWITNHACRHQAGLWAHC